MMLSQEAAVLKIPLHPGVNLVRLLFIARVRVGGPLASDCTSAFIPAFLL
jgi:hypothetical protein